MELDFNFSLEPVFGRKVVLKHFTERSNFEILVVEVVVDFSFDLFNW